MNEKIIVGLSGGVDSAVSALLLKQAGCRVEAMFMKNWDEDDADGCPAAEDLDSARRTADRIGIPLHTANFSAEYWERVFTHFLDEHRRGRTPNPDVLCNEEIKFKTFLERAMMLGAERIATGHYAGIEQRGGLRHLLKGADPDKDQSYFLHRLNQDQLARAVFPLAELRKTRVRKIAREHGLACHDRKDSTGICFIGERRYRDFLARYLPPRPGDIIDEAGNVVGRHQGYWYYTIGQRQGLGVGGIKQHNEGAWYIAAKDPVRNILTVVQGDNHPLLLQQRLRADQMHWIAEAARPGAKLRAKIRHRQAGQRCTFDNAGGGAIEVMFDAPQRAVTPGQSVVFYRGAECLGGAVISG